MIMSAGPSPPRPRFRATPGATFRHDDDCSQAVGHALADSPSGQGSMTNPQPGRIVTSSPERRLMRNEIPLYWLSDSATSFEQLYWENNANNLNIVDISIQIAVAGSPREICRVPRSGPGVITSSSIGTRSRRAVIPSRGSSRTYRPRSEQRSGHCAGALRARLAATPAAFSEHF
jgi:hypothetical protein